MARAQRSSRGQCVPRLAAVRPGLVDPVPPPSGPRALSPSQSGARTTGRIDDSTTLFGQVFAADEQTPLTNEVTVAVNPGLSAWTTISGVTFTGVVGGSKPVWDSARLRLRWLHTPVGGADTTQLRLTAVEVRASYAGS